MPYKCCMCTEGVKQLLPLRKFPTNSEMFTIWKERINHPRFSFLSNEHIRKYYRICQRHFTDECITHDGILKKRALPTKSLAGFKEEPTTENSFYEYQNKATDPVPASATSSESATTTGETNNDVEIIDKHDSKAEEVNDATLFDFTHNATNEGWTEKSDTTREVGMSTAALKIQKTKIFQRAVLFTLLNPQPNGACFAGVRNIITLNLEDYNNLLIRVRGQGENFNYKIVLRHKNENDEPFPTYEQFFTVVPKEFQEVLLPFSAFYAYYRGKKVTNAEPLDKSQITSIGIQIYGGVYLPVKQSGVSSLEIDWIKAIK